MKGRVRTRTLGWITVVWAVLVSTVLVWQTVQYRGIVAWLAEWQFRSFDRFFPVATVTILVFLLTLPFAILIALRLRRSAKRDVYSNSEKALHRASLFALFLKAGMALCAGVAAMLFVLGLAQDSVAEKPRKLDLAALSESSSEGPVQLRGTVLLNRLGFYREGFVITSRELWVAPLVVNDRSQKIEVFVQVARGDAGVPAADAFEGFLKRRAVPGGLVQLYQNAGYEVAERPHIIFADAAAARWPYWSAASDLVILLVLLGVLWGFHRRYRRNLERSIEDARAL
ncbi:MAG: hypothetical protein WBA51_18555 [Erythrobacter sp.]